MNDPEFLKLVEWRVMFRDAETDEYVSVRVEARSSNAAMGLASHQVEEGDPGRRRRWLSFECCESLPGREWDARSGRLDLLQRALRRSDAALQGHRGSYLALAIRVAANIIDRGV